MLVSSEDVATGGMRYRHVLHMAPCCPTDVCVLRRECQDRPRGGELQGGVEEATSSEAAAAGHPGIGRHASGEAWSKARLPGCRCPGCAARDH